jgi:hypothetical protein
VVGRLQQALLVYKAINQQIHPAIDAYSPHDLLQEIRDRAAALSRGRFRVEAALSPEVPAIWFLDRDLIEMALINAIQNSLAYARSSIRIEAGMEEGCLALTVRDDSDGYPEHILTSVATNTPYRATGTGLGLQFARLIARDNQGAPAARHATTRARCSLLLPDARPAARGQHTLRVRDDRFLGADLGVELFPVDQALLPPLIGSTPSCASTAKTSRLPSTSISSTVAVTSRPGGVAASWLTSICVPSVCSCGQSRCGLIALIQAHSRKPTRKPVANTSGMATNSGDSGYSAGTVFELGTTKRCW